MLYRATCDRSVAFASRTRASPTRQATAHPVRSAHAPWSRRNIWPDAKVTASAAAPREDFR